mmetsp:Transcript_27879/g.75125  ORF Transcript_27879/g.75125 Transcript_27879/m.75125 type:complete len:293 (+) Transcript_27879:1906-2784(+)
MRQWARMGNLSATATASCDIAPIEDPIAWNLRGVPRSCTQHYLATLLNSELLPQRRVCAATTPAGGVMPAWSVTSDTSIIGCVSRRTTPALVSLLTNPMPLSLLPPSRMETSCQSATTSRASAVCKSERCSAAQQRQRNERRPQSPTVLQPRLRTSASPRVQLEAWDQSQWHCLCNPRHQPRFSNPATFLQWQLSPLSNRGNQRTARTSATVAATRQAAVEAGGITKAPASIHRSSNHSPAPALLIVTSCDGCSRTRHFPKCRRAATYQRGSASQVISQRTGPNSMCDAPPG